jgi:apolipoprotein N-acyltransferase
MASAVLGALAMDFPQTLSVLIFIFLVPVILYVRSHVNESNGRLAVKMFVSTYCFAVLSTPWIASTFPLTWLGIPDPILGVAIVGAIWVGFGVALSVPMTPWIIFLRAAIRLHPYLQIVITSSAWIVLEYIRSWFVALGAYGGGVLFGPHHTYYSLSYVLSNVPVVRDLFAVGGLYLPTFLVVVVNMLVSLGYCAVRGDRAFRRPVAVVLGVVTLLVIVSSLAMSGIRSGGVGPTFPVSVVNTHLPSSTSIDIATKKAQAALDLIATIPERGGVLVLPENLDVLNTYLQSDATSTNPLSNFRLVLASQPDDHAHSMYFFEPQTSQGVRYRKQLLMPIGEYSVTWVEYLIRASRQDSWMSAYQHIIERSSHKGTGIALYRDRLIPDAVFSGSICAENISPYIFRDETRGGATVLTNISALSPFRNSPTLQRQTLAIDTVRAIENGRYLIVAGNDAKSFVVSDTGDLVAMSGTSTQSYFNAAITVRTYTTPYVAYGDYTVALAFAVLALAGLWLLI